MKVHKPNKVRIEGYWQSTQYPKDTYPLPKPNVLSEQEAKVIYDLIIEKEKDAQRRLYRGLSHSRITKETLGCAEYETDEFKWPADFAPHYVLEHKVKPTQEFLTYIGYGKKIK